MTSSESIKNDHGQQNGQQKGVLAFAELLYTRKKDALLWISRGATMMFTFFYLVPFFPVESHHAFYYALITNGITAVVRLNQRLPRIEFSRAFLSLLLHEDSCHYIFFSLIFFYSQPGAPILFPVFSFAMLHSCNFTLTVLQVLGLKEGWLRDTLAAVFIGEQFVGALRLISYVEIFLLPYNIFMLIFGKGSLLTTILYYRFLTLRFQSLRNPYMRIAFNDVRVLTEKLANQPAVPEIIRRVCHRFLALASRLAPSMPTT